MAENDRIAGKEFCILSGAIKFVSVRSSPRATWAFSKLQWLQYYFAKTLDSIPSFRKVKILLIPLILHQISNPKVLGFLFLRNIARPRELNVKKWTSESRSEFLLDKPRELFMNGTVI